MLTERMLADIVDGVALLNADGELYAYAYHDTQGRFVFESIERKDRIIRSYEALMEESSWTVAY